MDLSNDLNTGTVPLRRFLALLRQRLPFLGYIPLDAVRVLDHLGQFMPVPTMFCSTWEVSSDCLFLTVGLYIWTWQSFDYIINGYCKDRAGNRFIKRGEYEVVGNQDNQIISRSQFPGVVKSGMILEMSIIVRQRTTTLQDHKRTCPRCGHYNSSGSGWIEWQVHFDSLHRL